MAIGFPGSPFNKKQFSVDSKLYEYNSTLGVWSKGVRAPVSPGTASITDLSQLTDGSSLLDNVGSTIPSYATEVEILSQSVGVQDGQMAYAEDTDKLYVFSGYSWYKTSTAIEYVPPSPFSWGGNRGLIAGGVKHGGVSYSDTIEYFDITTAGNASTFGTLSTAKRFGGSGVSDSTYAVFGAGSTTGTVPSNTIEYITVATTSSATNFGNNTIAVQNASGVSDGTYGLFGGGYNSSNANSNVISYITIATPAAAQSFGTLTVARDGPASANDATYGLWAGGYSSVIDDTIDYVTIATPSTATDFGNMTAGYFYRGGSHDETYALFAGGNGSGVTAIDYVTTATPSSATSFGNLTVGRYQPAGSIANGIRGVFAGGNCPDPADNTVIDYVIVATPGNATDLSDLSVGTYYAAGSSGSPS